MAELGSAPHVLITGGTDEALLGGELPEAGQGSEKGSLGKCLNTHVHTSHHTTASSFIHTY